MAEGTGEPRLRSRRWFDDPTNPGMTALYLERYMNFGLTREELQGDRPIIGIAQTGSDLAPCNRHHLELAKRVRDGITAAGGVAFEFPCHPIQETGKRPTAALDRFCLTLGAVAGDIALAQGARAVAIAGGLGLRLADHLPRSGFRTRFIAKGRFERRMDALPVKLITHPQPGLFGAAAAFARRFA